MSKTLPRQHTLRFIGIFSYLLALHSSHLPYWALISGAMLMLWRGLITLKKIKPAPTVLLALMTIAAGAGILITYGGYLSAQSCVCALVVMSALKTLEMRNQRDMQLMLVLSYLIISCLFLFDQSILVFMLAIPALLAVTTAMIHLQHVKQSTKVLFATAIKLTLLALPLTILLFTFFPRPSQPLWGGFNRLPPPTLSGLSDHIALNEFGQTVKNGSVVFRVKFENVPPARKMLYWRGPVLWRVADNRWEIPDNNHRLNKDSVTGYGKPVRYTVTLEPNQHKWITLLDMAVEAPDFAYVGPGHSMITSSPIKRHIQFQASAYTDYRLGPRSLNKRTLRASLQLPSDNPKTVALGRQWSDKTTSDIVKEALRFYRQNGFKYTLSTPRLGKNAIDDFLFTHKKGFCEHFATSFVYLLRAAGVPSRVVIGYQGGERNGDYWIIRQSDAHAWAEVWFDEQGWVRVDPTYVVAPNRIEQSITDALQSALPSRNDTLKTKNASAASNNGLQTLSLRTTAKRYPLLHHALLTWDSAEQSWTDWVIRYQEKQQGKLLNQLLHIQLNTKGKIILCLLISLISAAVMLIILIVRHRQLLKNSRFQALDNKLKPLGLQAYPYETATAYALRIAHHLPHLEQSLLLIASTYNQMYYSNTENPKAYQKQIRRLVDELKLK